MIINHLYDLICEGSWEDKEACIYYTDFVMAIGIIFLNMMHHIHMLVRQIMIFFLLLFKKYFINYINYEPLTEGHLVVLLLLNLLISWQFFFWSFVHVYGNNWLSVADLIILRQLRFFSGNAMQGMSTQKLPAYL